MPDDALWHFILRDKPESSMLTNGISTIISVAEIEATIRSGATAMFMVGRTSGKTRGEINSIHADTRFTYTAIKDGKIKEESVVGKIILVVAPSNSTRTLSSTSLKPVHVGTEGDSGSPCYDHHGRLFGHYFGGRRECLEDDPPVVSIDGLHFVTPVMPNLEHMAEMVRQDPEFAGGEVKVEFL